MGVHAGLEALSDVLFEGVRRQRDDRNERRVRALQLPDLPCGGQSVHDGHPHIHQDRIEMALLAPLEQLDSPPAVVCLRGEDHTEAAGQLDPKAAVLPRGGDAPEDIRVFRELFIGPFADKRHIRVADDQAAGGDDHGVLLTALRHAEKGLYIRTPQKAMIHSPLASAGPMCYIREKGRLRRQTRAAASALPGRERYCP